MAARGGIDVAPWAAAIVCDQRGGMAGSLRYNSRNPTLWLSYSLRRDMVLNFQLPSLLQPIGPALGKAAVDLQLSLESTNLVGEGCASHACDDTSKGQILL